MPVMSKEKVMNVLHSFGMGKFAAVVMWVLHEVFAPFLPIIIFVSQTRKKNVSCWLKACGGGNFGHYDKCGKNMRNGGTISHAIWKLKRVMRLVSSYPEEVLCEPFFRLNN